jgi:hypothetical protein
MPVNVGKVTKVARSFGLLRRGKQSVPQLDVRSNGVGCDEDIWRTGYAKRS